MKVEIIAVVVAVAVGGGAGWWLAGPKAAPARSPTALAASASVLVSHFVRADASASLPSTSEPETSDAGREAVKDEAVVAGLAFQAHPCHPAYRARWLAAYKAYMQGWMAGRGSDGETGPDWKSTEDERIGMAMNAIHDKGLITDDEFADITIGVSPEGAQMLASTSALPKPAGLPERPGCPGAESSHAAG